MRRGKYGNKPTTIAGEFYASKREAKRHAELMLLERAGHIFNLEREVPFELARKVKIDGEDRARPPIRYRADFTYLEGPTRRLVVEDAKGKPTPVYRLKKHLMATVHGIHVVEV